MYSATRTSNASKGGYNELSAYGGGSVQAQRAQVEGWANDYKVPWLTNMQGIENLTREQVKAFADAHVTREMFKSLQDRKFTATQNAAVAKYAADRNMSAAESKDLYQTIGKASDAYVAGSPDPKKAAEDFAKLQTDMLTAPADRLPEAKRKMNEALKDAEKNNPDGAKDFDAYRKKFDIKRQEENATLEKRADQIEQTAEKSGRAEAKIAAKDAKLDFLNDDAPMNSPGAKTNEAPVPKAEAAKPAEPDKPKTPMRVTSAPAAPKV